MDFDKYDIYKFLDKIKNKNIHDIIEYGVEEIHKTKRDSYNIKGASKNRELGSVEYATELKAFLFFITDKIKPLGIDESLFQSFKPICKNLVEKEQLNNNIMKFFNHN